MRYHQVLTRFVLLAGLFLLALSFMSPAQAEEIWVEPGPGSKKSLGNWPTFKLKKKVSFKWHIPDDHIVTNSAHIVLLSLKDQDVGYQVDINVANSGDTLGKVSDDTTGPLTQVAMVKGQLTEIDISGILPVNLQPSDYVTVRFKRVGKAKLLILGLRYEYDADWTRDGTSLNYTAGNVGIGTTNPLQPLHVDGDGYVAGLLGLGTTSPTQKLDVIGSGLFSGRLGIQTALFPATSLHVAAGSNISPVDPGYVVVGDRLGFHLSMDPNEIQVWNDDAANTLFLNRFGGNILMADQISPRVGLGIGNRLGGALSKLHVRGANNMDGGLILDNDFDLNVWRIYTTSVTNTPNPNIHTLFFNWNGNDVGSIDGGSGAYTVLSDRRRKKNIETLGNTLDKVMALKPARFHFKTEGDSGSKHFGLIAQELKEVFPEVVRVNPEGEEFGPGEEGLHMVSYSELIPVLIKGMQEQQTIIQDMQKQLDRLEKAGWTLAGNK